MTKIPSIATGYFNMKNLLSLILLSLAPFVVSSAHAGCDTPLIEAVRAQEFTKVKMLVDAGADINAKGCNGKTALIESAVHSSTDIVTFLIDHGAKIDQQDDYGYTALIAAVTYLDDQKATQKLLSAGANTNIRDNSDRTAIMFAVDLQNSEALKLLANWKTTNLDASSKFYETGSNYYRYYCRQPYCTPLLVAAVNFASPNSQASKTFARAAVLELIKAGANPNLFRDRGYTYSNFSPMYKLAESVRITVPRNPGETEQQAREAISLYEEIRSMGKDVDFQPIIFGYGSTLRQKDLLNYALKVLKLNVNVNGPRFTPFCALVDDLSSYYPEEDVLAAKMLFDAGLDPALDCKGKTGGMHPLVSLANNEYEAHAMQILQMAFAHLPSGWSGLDTKTQSTLIQQMFVCCVAKPETKNLNLMRLYFASGAPASAFADAIPAAADLGLFDSVRYLVETIKVDLTKVGPSALRNAALAAAYSIRYPRANAFALYNYLLGKGVNERALVNSGFLNLLARKFDEGDYTKIEFFVDTLLKYKGDPALDPNAFGSDDLNVAGIVFRFAQMKSLPSDDQTKKKILSSLLFKLKQLGVDFNSFQTGGYKALRPLDLTILRSGDSDSWHIQDWQLATYLSVPAIQFGRFDCRSALGSLTKQEYPESYKLLSTMCP